MPQPKKAFFVGDGINNNGDFEYLDKANDNTVYNWQGNPDTQPGDIIVMYCLSPRSYIHSIWRAVTEIFDIIGKKNLTRENALRNPELC